MWLLLARNPLPDAFIWPGRRALAAVDAVLWPLICVLLLWQIPFPLGALGPTSVGVGTVIALARMRRAVWQNHRYRFAMWRWGRGLAVLLLFGVALKLSTLG